MEIKLKDDSIIRYILIYIGFAIVVSGGVFVQTINSLDEVWIFNFARCIANRTFTIQGYKHDNNPIISVLLCRLYKSFWG